MSNMLVLLRRLVTALFSSDAVATDPEVMPLRDWADLPAHHPLCD